MERRDESTETKGSIIFVSGFVAGLQDSAGLICNFFSCSWEQVDIDVVSMKGVERSDWC